MKGESLNLKCMFFLFVIVFPLFLGATTEDIDLKIQDRYNGSNEQDEYSQRSMYNFYTNGSVHVGISPDASHDVGVESVLSPPAGVISPGMYSVIGRVRNWGDTTETFDVTGEVYDTTTWTLQFTNTINLIDFPVGGDTALTLGQFDFFADDYFMTYIYTELGDTNPGNDTASVFSFTAYALLDVVFQMDAETPTGDNQLLGVEFDGTYFYVTGGGAGADSNKLYVLDVAGNLIWTMDQPAHSTGWGWRDLAWDGTYTGADRIDTLYASVNDQVDYFGIDLTTGTLNYYGGYNGPENPNRALAWYGDSGWFYTANFSNPIYWFDKSNPNLGSTANPWTIYGAAWADDPTPGGSVWWHTQDDPGTGWGGNIVQYDPATQSFTGLNFGYIPTITVPITAGGMCFYDGFMNARNLFCLVQGTPDAIIGLYIGPPGIEEVPVLKNSLVFELSQNFPNPLNDGHTQIAYTTSRRGPVSLKIYDTSGRLIKTLVDRTEMPGRKTVFWDGKDNNNIGVSAGIYFYGLTADGKTTFKKMVIVK
jgi:hypothetical protein